MVRMSTATFYRGLLELKEQHAWSDTTTLADIENDLKERVVVEAMKKSDSSTRRPKEKKNVGEGI